jgi:hypothetical protein
MAKQPAENAEPKDTKPASANYSTFHNSRVWLYGLLGLFILIIVFAAGVGAANHHQQQQMLNKPSGFGIRFVGDRPFGRPGGFDNSDGITTSNGQTRTAGVVTNVNGSSFTLAGHGATINVMTSTSTEYQGGNQVKQNDSVIVLGSNNNGTINATQVVINP